MAKRGHSEEEILRLLREAESGDTVVEICRKHGITQQSFYLGKRQYAGLGLNELARVASARKENGKLKRPVRPNQNWSMDFVAKRLPDGRWIRVLTVVNQFTSSA